MATKPATSTKDSSTVTYETDASLWQQRYRIATNNQRNMFRRFADWYDDFYAVIQSKNYSLWRSKVYIPILASKAWNMISKFISLKPGFEVRVRADGITSYDLSDPEGLEDKASKAQLKLEYDYDNPNLDQPVREKLLSVLIDATVTGTGLAKVPWTVCKETKYEHPVSEDGTIDMTKETVTESYEGYNDIIPVNIMNVFMAPSATSLQAAPWIIIKDWKTLDQLKKINAAKGVEVYKNLTGLENARSNGDEFAVYKKARNRLTTQQDPITADQTVDFFEVFECYDKNSNEIITFANGGGTASKDSSWVEIRRQNNPYWHGHYPLVAFYVKKRPYDFWGQGIFETTQRLQRAANDVFNHYMDNWNLSVDGMLMAQESTGINDYIVEPGGLITYRTEEPKQFKFPEPNPAALNMVMQQIMGAIENDTISQYATGTPDSDTDKTRGTKGGIEALQQAADDMTGFMRQNFQQSIKTVGEYWLSNNQQFMFKATTVMAAKGNKKVPITISPADMQATMDLRVDDASMLPISDDQMKAQFSAFTQQLMQYQQASLAQHNLLGTPPLALNFAEIVEEMAEKFGFRNVQSFLGQLPPGQTPMEQQKQAQAQQQQQEQQMAQAKQAQAMKAPSLQEKMIESLDYKDVPDDIKRQMEAQAGFQPSQGVANSQAPHVAKANQDVLKMAQDLHAKGALHPSVLDMVHGHLGMPPVTPAPQVAPIGEPPMPPQQLQPQGA